MKTHGLIEPSFIIKKETSTMSTLHVQKLQCVEAQGPLSTMKYLLEINNHDTNKLFLKFFEPQEAWILNEKIPFQKSITIRLWHLEKGIRDKKNCLVEREIRKTSAEPITIDFVEKHARFELVCHVLE